MDTSGYTGLSLEGWVRRLSEDEIRWEYGTSSLLMMHEALHMQFGDDPNEAIIPGEQRLSSTLGSRGFPHRKDDELSRVAGTYQENPPLISAYEFSYYLSEPFVLATGVTKLVTNLDNPSEVYLYMENNTLPGMAASILKALNRRLPAELKLKQIPRSMKADFVQLMALHDLALTESYGPPQVALWETLRAQMRKEASEASTVFKSDEDPRIFPSVVLKSTQPEDDSLFVLGLSLRPGVIDKTQSVLKDGRVTEGDVYTKDDVERGAHWFATNSRHFALGHVMLGGKPFGDSEVRMVENNIHRGPDWENGRVLKGDWLVGARAYSDEAKDAFLSGDANAWSIGARMAYEVIEVEG